MDSKVIMDSIYYIFLLNGVLWAFNYKLQLITNIKSPGTVIFDGSKTIVVQIETI